MSDTVPCMQHGLYGCCNWTPKDEPPDDEPQSVDDQLRGKLADAHYELGMLYQNLRRLVDNKAFCPRCARIISRQVLTPKETP